jgi:hypothetical protein
MQSLNVLVHGRTAHDVATYRNLVDLRIAPPLYPLGVPRPTSHEPLS